MIVPEGLTLEEMIGAIKVHIQTVSGAGDSDNYAEMYDKLYILEVIQRELNKKADK